ncbi:unnamed protein product [Withania somnifera]
MKLGLGFKSDESKDVFGSDDFPVDVQMRMNLSEIKSVEDALWGEWFEKKSEFLRRDRMLKSNLEVLNPNNNPMLQDPDGAGITGLSRGDKIVLEGLMNEVKRRTLNGNARIGKRVVPDSSEDPVTRSKEEIRNGNMKVVVDDARGEVSGIFMVWNSPAWMFTARYQKGLESVLNQHQDACVVVFSETIELNFFSGFVKDGFKVAVVMPNLDELLLDTPTRVFASVWYEWKRTKHYPFHYSELIRLAALYKFGGIYLDSDIIVLNSLSSLNNTIGFEDDLRGKNLNGAVMAFRKHSPFVMECLKEFYAAYDETQLRWSGADLLTIVASKFSANDNLSSRKMEINLQPSFLFFPISHNKITKYFSAPATETEKAEQDMLFKTIHKEAVTFHFWNGLTSAMVPEPGSLAYRIINYYCIRCSDTL